VEEIPDPTRKAKELREEFTRKIHEIVFDEFNKAGRSIIAIEINKLIEKYHRALRIELALDTKVSAQPQSGMTCHWADLPMSEIPLPGDVTPRDQEFIRKINTIIVEEFNQVGQGPITERINQLMLDYGLDPGPFSVALSVRVIPGLYRAGGEHFVWSELQTSIKDSDER
jgi:hypothetical protein